MTNDMLRNIDVLRERANVSYEEAMALLEKHGGDIMPALVELEREGRVYGPSETEQQQETSGGSDVLEKAGSLIQKAFKTRVVVEKKREDGEVETVANVSAPVAAGLAVIAPWITLATTGIAFATDHSMRIEKEDDANPENK